MCTRYGYTPASTGNVTAVAIKDTVSEGIASGYLATYPAGGSLPAASDLDWQRANENVANLTIAPASTGGQVTFAPTGLAALSNSSSTSTDMSPTDDHGRLAAVPRNLCTGLRACCLSEPGDSSKLTVTSGA